MKAMFTCAGLSVALSLACPIAARAADDAKAVCDVMICSGAYDYQSPKLPAPMKGYHTRTLDRIGGDWKILVLSDPKSPSK